MKREEILYARFLLANTAQSICCSISTLLRNKPSTTKLEIDRQTDIKVETDIRQDRSKEKLTK